MKKLELTSKELAYLADVCGGRVAVPPDAPESKALERGAMHCWQRTPTGAQCVWCKIVLTGEDAEDVFRPGG